MAGPSLSTMVTAGSGSLGNLFVRLMADSTNLVKGMQQAEMSVASGASKMGKQLTLLSAGAATAFGAIGISAVKSFADFDKAMTTSTSIMTGVNAELRKELEQTAKQISLQTTTSAKELAEAYFFLASAGLDAKQSQEALVTVNQFAIAGSFNLSKATDLLASSQAALGLRTDDAKQNMINMTRVADVLTKANIVALGTVEDFAEALTNRTAAALRQTNKELEEGVAILAAFAMQGVKGKQAGEQLHIVTRDLQRAALKSREEFKRFGVTVFDSATKEMRPMWEILGDLEELLNKMPTELKRVTIEQMKFQDRSLGSLLTLLGTSKAMKEFHDEFKAAGGTVREVSEKQMTSFSDQLKITKNHIDLLKISIGEGLAPVLLKFNDAIKGIAKEEHATVIVNIIKAVGLAVAAFAAFKVAGLVIGFTKLLTTFGTLAPLMGGFGKSITAIGLASKAAVASFALVSWHLIALGLVVATAVKGWQAYAAAQEEAAASDALEETTHRLTVTLAKQVKQLRDMGKITKEESDRMIDALAKSTASGNVDMQIGANKAVRQAIKEKIDAEFEFVSTAKLGSDVIADYGFNIEAMTKKFAEAEEAAKNVNEEVSKIDPDLILMKAAMKEFEDKSMAPSFDPKTGRMTKAGAFDDSGMSQAVEMENEIQRTKAWVVEMEELAYQEMETFGTVHEEKLAALEDFNKKLAYLQQQQAIIVLQSSQAIFTDLSSITKTFAGEQSGLYKTMFAASKAFAIAEATVNIATGLAKAFNQPWPLNLIAAGQVIAATASIVSNIKATQLEFGGGKRLGGSVSANTAYMVGESGRELFVPGTDGNIIPNDELMGAGGVRVQINNFTDGTATVTERDEGGEHVVEVTIQRAKREIASEIRDGRGEVSRSMEQTFNLRRGKQ